MDRNKLRQVGLLLIALGVIGFLWAGWLIPDMGPQMLMPSSLIARYKAEAARYHTIQAVCVLAALGGLALVFLPIGENKSFDQAAAEELAKQAAQFGQEAAGKIQDVSRQAAQAIASAQKASSNSPSTDPPPPTNFVPPSAPVHPVAPASPAPPSQEDFEPLGLSPDIDLAPKQPAPPAKPETGVAPGAWKKVSDDDLNG